MAVVSAAEAHRFPFDSPQTRHLFTFILPDQAMHFYADLD